MSRLSPAVLLGSLALTGALAGACYLGGALCSSSCVPAAAAAPARRAPAAVAPDVAAAAKGTTAKPEEEEGHYCDARAFSPAVMRRKLELLQQIAKVASEPKEIPGGYSFSVPGELRETGEWLDGIRGCCPTLDLEVSFPKKRGAVMVRLSGGAGAREFIRAELEPLFERHAKE